MKVLESISQFLKDNEIRTVFGVLGDANLFYVDHWVRNFKGKYVAAAHEAGATVTQGPALANALPALLEGARARLSIVLMAGDISLSRTHLQSLSQRELVLGT